jgi:hypothetical protein
MANVVTMFGRSTRTETTTTAAKTSTLSSTGAFANGFRAFAGDSNKLPPANETPVETRMRKTLVKAVVKHAGAMRGGAGDGTQGTRHSEVLEELRREQGAQAQAVGAAPSAYPRRRRRRGDAAPAQRSQSLQRSALVFLPLLPRRARARVARRASASLARAGHVQLGRRRGDRARRVPRRLAEAPGRRVPVQLPGFPDPLRRRVRRAGRLRAEGARSRASFERRGAQTRAARYPRRRPVRSVQVRAPGGEEGAPRECFASGSSTRCRRRR